ncbi:unnamed protein product [Protopolystoma xenopodis]|uniref:Uncharacterized protein n=1 Tax=Protopolystoma xenopodis TaxID=117903 RepID=A0A3S4ZVJ2_9PLAT|nr:unnamed protein product [Protopolystoma xenopodis]
MTRWEGIEAKVASSSRQVDKPVSVGWTGLALTTGKRAEEKDEIRWRHGCCDSCLYRRWPVSDAPLLNTHTLMDRQLRHTHLDRVNNRLCQETVHTPLVSDLPGSVITGLHDSENTKPDTCTWKQAARPTQLT